MRYRVSCVMISSVLSGALVSLGLFETAHGDITTPPGMDAGGLFRLAFVSTTTTNAQSDDLTTYDAFVQNVANGAGLGTYNGQAVAWQVIGSTPGINANDAGRLSASETIPIYLVSGDALVDGGAADLWDGSIDVPFNVTETGSELGSGFVWTGTFRDGSAASPFSLGSSLNGAIEGATSFTDDDWIERTLGAPLSNLQHLYGVSQALTAVVPEPGCLALLMAACGIVVSARPGGP